MNLDVAPYIKTALIIIGSLIGLRFILYAIGIRVIGSTEVGIVEKWWSQKGSVDQAIIALNGEAGFQPGILRAGIHLLSPLIYRVHKQPLITVPQGQMAYVFARDGQPLPPTQLLGKIVDPNQFLDARTFLTKGGQRGPQRAILREGTYAINTALFAVITSKGVVSLAAAGKDDADQIRNMSHELQTRGGFAPVVIGEGGEDEIGVVTVNEGPNLAEGHIICPIVGDDPSGDNYHHCFQDIEAFLAAGGRRGKQYQVLLDGTYYINRLFAIVRLEPKTIVDVGKVGVVISFYGEKGQDTSGAGFTHGELVEVGKRGIWDTPLQPGKYAINPDAAKVLMIPTTNFVLKWETNQQGEHGYDKGLAAVNLITKDAFEPELPLSVVLSIAYNEAPQLIQRFGDVRLLVEQSLDPMVSAFFKNAGQERTLLELIQQRAQLGESALKEMKERFGLYNLQLHEVLIGTPRSSDGDTRIESMYTQLRDRQLAREQIETYQEQGRAADESKILQEKRTRAEQQESLTQSAIKIEIQGNEGSAQLARAKQDAERIVVTANAEATQVKVKADADALRTTKLGIAEGVAIEQSVNAYGGPEYQVFAAVWGKIAEALKEGKQALVPSYLINMGGGGDQGGVTNAIASFMSILGMDKIREFASEISRAKDPSEVDAVVSKVKNDLVEAASKIGEEVETVAEAEPKPEVAAPQPQPAEVLVSEPVAKPSPTPEPERGGGGNGGRGSRGGRGRR